MRFCMQVLALMVATFELDPYAQFHIAALQKEILSKWNMSPTSLDNKIWTGRRASLVDMVSVLIGWGVLSSYSLDSGHDCCQPVRLGRSPGLKISKGHWTLKEARVAIKVLEL